MRKKIISLVSIVLVLIGSSYWIGFSLGKERDTIYKELSVFAEALALVEKKYVESKPAQDLTYGAMKGLLMALDSYSQFLTADDYKELLVETEGQFGGLGIEITIKDGLLTIVSPIEDTPAWKAGLQAGDIIVKIEGESTRGITLIEAVKRLRGEPGTSVTITVFREKDRKLEDVIIMRKIIKIKDIKNAVILEDNIGYVRIAEFRETTPKDLQRILGELEKEDLKGLVIDVRNNPGGLLNSAIAVASIFLDKKKTVVSTKTREGQERIYRAISLTKKYLRIPIVVLINKGSASGSEILAAALRENGRAILLGNTTFGKGSVQTVIPLSDGSALRLTTAKYYTPSGVSIHEKGIEPDIVVKEEIRKVKEDVFGELDKDKKEKFDHKRSYQILRALDLIRGLLVMEVAVN